MGWLIEYALQRLHNKQNFLMAVFGQTGTGKSYGALSIAELVDPNFNADKIVFSSEEFMQILTRKDEFGNMALQKGSMVVFDEAGVGIDSRRWYSVQNRIIKNVMQTFRHYQIGVIFTTPHMGYIDKSVRKLLHCVAEMIDPNVQTRRGTMGWGWSKVYQVQINPLDDRWYRQFPKVRQGNRWLKIEGKSPAHGNTRFDLASEYLIRAYEMKKAKYTEKLNQESQDTMLGITKELDMIKVLRYILDHELNLGIQNVEDIDRAMITKIKTMMGFDYPKEMKKVRVKTIEDAANMYLMDRSSCRELVKDNYQKTRITKKDWDSLIHLFKDKKDWLLVAYELGIDDKKLINTLKKWEREGYKKSNEIRTDQFRIYDDDVRGIDLGFGSHPNGRQVNDIRTY